MKCRLVSLLVWLLLFAGTVWAQDSTLTVNVTDRSGGPIVTATVCVKLDNSSTARLTDSNGRAVLSGLPVGDYTLYVFKNGFATLSQLVLLNGDQSKNVTLPAGTTQPPTDASCSTASFITIPNPKITSFEIFSLTKNAKLFTGDSTTTPDVRVAAQFSRSPHFYRLAEVLDINHPEAELRTQPWLPYTEGMSFHLRLNTTRPYGVRNVFMQINWGTSESSASPAKGDSIVFAPAATKTFTLTGSSLQAFVDRARTLGYSFEFTGPVIQGNPPCPGVLRPDDYRFMGDAIVGDTSTNFTEAWSFKIFQRPGPLGPFLNAFWKVKSISIADIFVPARTSDITQSGPLSGRADDPSRSISFKRAFSWNPDTARAAAYTCVLSTPGFSISSITLEGPDDKQPVDALTPTSN
ncbi:MAG TPA: carboxypeptidase-like regulatory domain-containing protein [Pyrinomonadaceae bacterium]|nr:carboxypeptidase-like regulatory domain-containing protein [Pyrinomonadaceae bacterium]